MAVTFVPRQLVAWPLALAATIAACSTPQRGENAGSTATAAVLPSWADGPNRQRIIDFVERTTTPGDAQFVPPAERIAVFDNDGTLWSEQPMYFEVLFTLDRVKAMAPQHPEWRKVQPFKGLLEGDRSAVAAAGKKGAAALIGITHTGMTRQAFDSIVRGWMATARHPVTGKPYTSMIYQPQVELLQYLRDKGYKTYIVSGGFADFMRPWTDSIYGVPPEQVVGSRPKLQYRTDSAGKGTVFIEPALDLVDDHAGKPVGIAQVIGRRPIIAVGNSDGDYEMLEYTTTGAGPRLGILIHHDDAEREYAYDRASHIGTLSRGLDSAAAKGWILTSMKDDWKAVYPQDPSPVEK